MPELMTSMRVDWTDVRPIKNYYNFYGITAEQLMLVERGSRPQMVAVDKSNDYRIKLFAATVETEGEEETTLSIQLKDSVVQFTRKSDTLLEAQLGSRDEMMRIVYQRGEMASTPTGPIDACLEGTFDLDLEHAKPIPLGGMACPGNFPDYPEWLGEDAKVYITHKERESGSGAYVTIVCPNVAKQVLNRVRFLRVNGYWMSYMPYGDSLFMTPDPRDADEIRQYAGGVIENEAPPMQDRNNLRTFFYKYVPGANRNGNWSGKAAKIYGAWREAVFTYERYDNLATLYGQYLINNDSVNKYQAELDNAMTAAQRKYEQRPQAYANYSLENFAEETKDDQRFGAVKRYLDAADYLMGRVQQARNIAQDIYQTYLDEGNEAYQTIEAFAEAKKDDPQYASVKQYLDTANEEEAEAAENRVEAEALFAMRPTAYANYSLEMFAEETKHDKRFGWVKDRLNRVKELTPYIADKKADRDRMFAKLQECYAARDANDKVLEDFNSQFQVERVDYFTF